MLDIPNKPVMPATAINPKPLMVIIITALCLQLLGHYFATKLLFYGGFQALWPILRIILPAIILILLAIPLKVIYFKLPRFDKTSLRVVVFACIGLVLLAFYLANYADDYLAYYRRGASIEFLRETQRFQQFMMFTLSTLIAWEIFHRGFLLGAIRYCLTTHLQLHARSADIIAMLFLAVFEVLFHIKKPMYESFPLIFASLALSWLTIRTGSIWPALVIHLMIEVIFGYSAYIGW